MVRSAAALLAATLLLAAALPAQRGDRSDADREDLPDGLVVPAAPVIAPAAAAATVQLQEGFLLELVASEPLIGDPVAATFDAAGRLWVVEMRGFMKDVDATGEHDPDGRVVVLVDRDGDGRMDDAVPFLEHLVLPRAVLPLPGGALVIAPPDLLWASDADGDLHAEHTTVVCSGFDSGRDNPEHSGNGLLWALDDRIHIADDARMLRWQGGAAAPRFLIENGAGGGQWGIAQDDRGRLFFNYNEDWLRCDLVPGRYAARGGEAQPFNGLNWRVVQDRSVHPVHITPGVNRGGNDGILQDGRLVRHTAACAPLVYRGRALPGCDGDVFVCEPAANLVRRFRLDHGDAQLSGANACGDREFLASTDERFRPVNLCQGPDGALYVVDMYRGLIQHRNFVTTFLRKQVLARGLERPTGLGRIWRVVAAPSPHAQPRPLAACDTAQLVARLCDRDGWQRDTAQRLLVTRMDRTAVLPLRALLRSDATAVAKGHALAVLRSLGALSHDDLRRVLQETDAGLLALALGECGPHLQRGDAVLWTRCEELARSAPPSVRWHLALLLGDVTGRLEARAFALLAALAAAPADTVLAGCVVCSARGREPEFVRHLLPAATDRAAEGLLRSLARAVGEQRDGHREEDLLQEAAASMLTWQQAALLQGLLDALPREPARQRGFFVFAATPPALLAMARTGAPDVVPLVQRVLALTELRPEAVTAPPAVGDAELTDAERARVAAGARVFGSFCAACHQPNGAGMAGLAPPLRRSEWVSGAPERLIRIALHGLRGPLSADGVSFDGEMPGQAHLGDEDLAAALSFLRRSFGHQSPLIAPPDVAAERAKWAARTGPWSPDELGAGR